MKVLTVAAIVAILGIFFRHQVNALLGPRLTGLYMPFVPFIGAAAVFVLAHGLTRSIRFSILMAAAALVGLWFEGAIGFF